MTEELELDVEMEETVQPMMQFKFFGRADPVINTPEDGINK